MTTNQEINQLLADIEANNLKTSQLIAYALFRMGFYRKVLFWKVRPLVLKKPPNSYLWCFKYSPEWPFGFIHGHEKEQDIVQVLSGLLNLGIEIGDRGYLPNIRYAYIEFRVQR